MTRYEEGNSFRWPPAAELRWAAAFAAAVMALTCLPYLYGLLVRPPGYYYSGLLANPDEHNVYLAYMKQAQQGAFFFLDPFTSEPQQPRVINVFFLGLGLLARVTHLPLPVVYHLARLVSGWLLLMAIYCLGAQVLPTVAGRRLALILAASASGLGWWYRAQPGQPHPIDFGPGLIMPEAVTFLSLLLNPLFCFSMFLMASILGLAGHAFTSGSPRSAVLAGLAGLLLGNIHTYDLIPVAAVLAGFLVLLLAGKRLTWKRVSLVVLIGLLASPSVIYQLWLMRTGDITIAVKTVETPVSSPAPFFLALGLGLPLTLAVVGVGRTAVTGGGYPARMVALWLAFGFALAYAPVPFQRKLAEGLHIPVCLLAVFAIAWLWTRRGEGRRALWVMGGVLVVLAVPSNALFIARAVRDLRTNNQAYLGNLMPPLYLRADQYAALHWLDGRASREDLLLCNSFLGSYAPSLVGTRVYVGHWAETRHFRDKVSALARFLRADTSDAERETFCRRQGITYMLRDHSIYDEVYYVSAEGARRAGFDPLKSAWLAPVFEQSDVSLYRVK